MHVGIVSDSLIDFLALKTNLVADPILKTQVAFTMARSIMVSVELGIFEALVDRDKTSEDIAKSCQCHPKSTRALLNVMVSCDYLDFNSSNKQYSLKPLARKWLIRSSPHSICDKIIFQNFEWNFLNQLSSYVKDGQYLDLHHSLCEKPEQLNAYQRGMADIGKLALAEVNRKIPIPKNARNMLDIGGASGTYSAAFVKSRPQLGSIVLDLPEAVSHAKNIFKAHALPTERLDIKSGNALEDDLGNCQYDFIFLSNVAHHLGDEQNQMLAKKAYNALKTNGVYCILELIRTDNPTRKNQFGAIFDLYFGLTSQSGTWSIQEISKWLQECELNVKPPIHLRTAPGIAMVYGIKS